MSPAKILIIDDNQSFAESVGQRLKRLDFEVIYALDGVSALTVAVNSKPDLLILDFQMPAADGGTALERLRRHPDTKHLPVILLTGVPIDEVRSGFRGKETFITNENFRFLKKPVDYARLEKALRDLLPQE